MNLTRFCRGKDKVDSDKELKMRRSQVQVELGVPHIRRVLHKVGFLVEIGLGFKSKSINRAVVLLKKNCALTQREDQNTIKRFEIYWECCNL